MRRLGAVLGAGLLLVAWGGVADAQLIERYMKGYQGPYQARVVDEETKAPLPGTAILVIWEYDKLEFLHSRVTFHDARETLTDANGEFILDVPEIEKHLPSRTLKPRFVIFKPGYPSSEGYHAARGETIGLKRLGSIERRRDNASLGHLGLLSVPRKTFPLLLRLINEEAVSVGLRPYPME